MGHVSCIDSITSYVCGWGHVSCIDSITSYVFGWGHVSCIDSITSYVFGWGHVSNSIFERMSVSQLGQITLKFKEQGFLWNFF